MIAQTAEIFKVPDRTRWAPRDDSATVAGTLKTSPSRIHAAPRPPGHNCCTSAGTDRSAVNRERSLIDKNAPASWPIPEAKTRDQSISCGDSRFPSFSFAIRRTHLRHKRTSDCSNNRREASRCGRGINTKSYPMGSSCCFNRNASRNVRLYRLRFTADPSFLPTDNPKRE